MRKRFGVALIAASVIIVACICYFAFRIDYWAAAPSEKFKRSWAEDVGLLEKSQKLPKEWKSIKEVKISGDSSPVQDWIQNLKAPVATTSDGKYKLDVFVIHWLEGYRYGVILQYHLVDLSNDNTIWELGRTLKLGVVY